MEQVVLAPNNITPYHPSVYITIASFLHLMTVYFVFQVLYNKGCIGVYVASGKCVCVCVCAIIQEYTKDVLDEGGLGKGGRRKSH